MDVRQHAKRKKAPRLLTERPIRPHKKPTWRWDRMIRALERAGEQPEFVPQPLLPPAPPPGRVLPPLTAEELAALPERKPTAKGNSKRRGVGAPVVEYAKLRHPSERKLRAPSEKS